MNLNSCIDCFKKNVFYVTQLVVFSWRNFERKRSFIYEKYVTIFIEIDEKFQQLKHRQSRNVVSITIFNFQKLKISSNFLNIKFSSIVLVVVVTSIVFISSDDSMNLNFVMTIVQGKSLVTSKVKDICNKWKLCYYCKLQHSSKTIKKCSNKKFFSFRVVDLNDNINIDEDVFVYTRKV